MKFIILYVGFHLTPAAFTFLNGKMIKIFKAVKEESNPLNPVNLKLIKNLI